MEGGAVGLGGLWREAQAEHAGERAEDAGCRWGCGEEVGDSGFGEQVFQLGGATGGLVAEGANEPGVAVLDFKGRSAIPCIGQERADLVVAGCAILQAIYETWPVIQFRVGDRGLREGILTDLLDEIAGAV